MAESRYFSVALRQAVCLLASLGGTTSSNRFACRRNRQGCSCDLCRSTNFIWLRGFRPQTQYPVPQSFYRWTDTASFFDQTPSFCLIGSARLLVPIFLHPIRVGVPVSATSRLIGIAALVESHRFIPSCDKDRRWLFLALRVAGSQFGYQSITIPISIVLVARLPVPSVPSRKGADNAVGRAIATVPFLIPMPVASFHSAVYRGSKNLHRFTPCVRMLSIRAHYGFDVCPVATNSLDPPGLSYQED